MAASRMQSIAAIAVAFAAVASLPGCSGKESADATSRASEPVPARSSAPAPTTLSPRTEKWTALQSGQCLADGPPTDPAVVTVTIVDCTQTHLAEVYLRADIPVNEALSDVAGSQCDTGFTAYTGMAVAGSGFTTTYLIDSDQDRTDNNPYPSTVICLLQDARGGSLTNSAVHRPRG